MNFHDTGYGKQFFNQQLPQLIRVIDRMAIAIQDSNRIAEEQRDFAERQIIALEKAAKFAEAQAKGIPGGQKTGARILDNVNHRNIKRLVRGLYPNLHSPQASWVADRVMDHSFVKSIESIEEHKKDLESVIWDVVEEFRAHQAKNID